MVAALMVPFGLSALAETQARGDLRAFDEISVSAGIRVVFTQGDVQSVEIENANGNFDDIIVSVDDETLVLKRPNRRMGRDRDYEDYLVRVTAPTLEEVEASSSGQFEAQTLAADTFEVSVSSAGSVRIGTLQAQSVEVDASSGASAVLAGTCEAIEIDASSGASVEAGLLVCSAADIDASSGAQVEAFASAQADIEASSGAGVNVIGAPAERSVETSSGATVDFAL